MIWPVCLENIRFFELPLISALLLYHSPTSNGWMQSTYLLEDKHFQGLVFDTLSLFCCSLVIPDHLMQVFPIQIHRAEALPVLCIKSMTGIPVASVLAIVPAEKLYARIKYTSYCGGVSEQLCDAELSDGLDHNSTIVQNWSLGLKEKRWLKNKSLSRAGRNTTE